MRKLPPPHLSPFLLLDDLFKLAERALVSVLRPCERKMVAAHLVEWGGGRVTMTYARNRKNAGLVVGQLDID